MDALTSPAVAIELVEKERGKPIPERLRLRILRLAEMLTPQSIIDLVKSLYKCYNCTKGLQGSAIDRTLRYCTCMWGEELRFVNPDYPAREIVRVHADAKSLMVRACGLNGVPNQIGADELGIVYVGDAILSSDVIEDSDTVTIMPASKDDALALRPQDLERIRKRLEWTRKVRVMDCRSFRMLAVSPETTVPARLIPGRNSQMIGDAT